MLEKTDFSKKQIIFVFANAGERIALKTDNLVIYTREGKVKFQITCYRLFAVFVIGDLSITSGIIRVAKKYGFVIVLMTQSFKLYSIIGNRMEGNTLLHRKQYQYDSDEIARFLVRNKILNQRHTLNSLRNKNELCKEAIVKLDKYINEISQNDYDTTSLLGIEGSAARLYFVNIFDNVCWKGRKPRIKFDYVNATLDIGYNILFNLVDSLLQLYGFDTFCGVYHKEFYMRKSLACDIMEPIRPVVDFTIRKAINLKQCKESDFDKINNQYMLSYKKSPEYVRFIMEGILEYKDEIFMYIQSYYRAFMKSKSIKEYRMFSI